MSKHVSPFKFKQFSVTHHRSSMKVGVDGVLIGSWTDVDRAKSILDVGTGCGLISLMMAQRNPNAKIIGIDIDESSVDEASDNVRNSPWNDRISIFHGDFPGSLHPAHHQAFDLIVSNPPFFDSGLQHISTSRERARHQDSLSPLSLLKDSVPLLNPGGSIAMVIPAEFTSLLEKEACKYGYALKKKCLVRGNSDASYKRLLIQWQLSAEGQLSAEENKKEEAITEFLTLESHRGVPTEEYRNLCKEFYLKF